MIIPVSGNNRPSGDEMSIEIDHKNRKKIILQKALLLFAEQGYASVTFQKIANNCGMSRTTLYRYFADKREILDESIHNFFAPMLQIQCGIAAQKNRSAHNRLTEVLKTAIDSLFAERTLLIKIMEYLLTRKNTGEEISSKIIRHTLTLRLLMHRLLVEGIKNGEFHPCNLRIANNLLYSQLETLTFRLIMLGDTDREETSEMLSNILLGLQAHEK